MTSGPIVIVEADKDTREFYADIINAIGVHNELRFFENSQKTLNYLYTTTEQPFIILSEINLDGDDGLQLKEAIQNDDYLKEKGLPFVFITADATAESIRKAHWLGVQGYFVKPRDMVYVEQMMVKIFDYWELCKHINNT